MKILYLAPYRQSDRWGLTSLEYLRALQTTGAELVCRPMCFHKDNLLQMSDSIEQLERRREPRFDAVLQFCPPQFFIASDNSIGMCLIELAKMDNPIWTRCLNLMPNIIVASKPEKVSLIASGVKSKIHTVPCPVNLDVRQTTYNKPAEIERFTNNPYIFYYIGEYNQSRNLPALYTAFHSAFHYRDPVELVVQLQHTATADLPFVLNDEITKLKKGLAIYGNPQIYKRENFLVGYFNEQKRHEIHAHSHCFVNPRRTIEFDVHEWYARAFNNAVITTYTIERGCTTQPCMDMNMPGLWKDIHVVKLIKAMRHAFNDRWKSVTPKWSYFSIGQKMLEVICSAI